MAGHCTEQEDNATKVERQVRKSAAALLLESRVGERFDAIVTGASPKGTWVRIDHPAAEGRVMRGYKGSMSATASRSSWSTPTSSAASLISPASESHEAQIGFTQPIRRRPVHRSLTRTRNFSIAMKPVRYGSLRNISSRFGYSPQAGT